MADKIHGNQDGENGANDSYSIPGRSGNMPRKKLVKEVEEGKHPNFHVYEREDEKYIRANPDKKKANNVDKD